MKNKIPSLLSTIGLFFTVIVSPCCFPMFGFVLAGFGVATDTFELFGKWTMLIFQYMVLFSLVNLTLNYAINRNIWIFGLALISTFIIFYGFDDDFNRPVIYAGMLGLLVAQGSNFYIQRKQINTNMNSIVLESIITCPDCGHKKLETMPIDACQFFYECEKCQIVLKPQSGDCCVFCSYGTVKCPPIQAGTSCCQ
jgi:hypothetical protein